MFGLHFNPFKSWTIAGVVTVLGTGLVNHFDPTALGAGVSFVLHSVGVLVGGIGARNAVAKAVIAIVQALGNR
jgi:hypothetical protein